MVDKRGVKITKNRKQGNEINENRLLKVLGVPSQKKK